MTKEEARNLIKRVRTKGQYVGDYYMRYTDSATPYNQDIDILEEALEKQIPKKPTHDGFYYRCPICNGIIYKGRGCANNECRQKIDWSGNND